MTWVDSHIHFWRLERGDYSWLRPDAGPLYRDFQPEEALPLLSSCGVRHVVAVQAAPTEAETHYLFELTRQHPFISGVVGWVDFESADVAERVRLLVADGQGRLKGLRPMVQDITDPHWLTRSGIDPAFHALMEHDLVFDALVTPRHVKVLTHRLRLHPRLRVVVDHAAKPDVGAVSLTGWMNDLEELAANTAAYCKLSGLVTEGGEKPSSVDLDGLVTFLLRIFGPTRLCWGSDWPVLTTRGEYREWFHAAFDLVRRRAPGSEAAIFGENAVRLYRLSF
jgi:L-fucono-1,5-lactonase